MIGSDDEGDRGLPTLLNNTEGIPVYEPDESPKPDEDVMDLLNLPEPPEPPEPPKLKKWGDYSEKDRIDKIKTLSPEYAQRLWKNLNRETRDKIRGNLSADLQRKFDKYQICLKQSNVEIAGQILLYYLKTYGDFSAGDGTKVTQEKVKDLIAVNKRKPSCTEEQLAKDRKNYHKKIKAAKSAAQTEQKPLIKRRRTESNSDSDSSEQHSPTISEERFAPNESSYHEESPPTKIQKTTTTVVPETKLFEHASISDLDDLMKIIAQDAQNHNIDNEQPSLSNMHSGDCFCPTCIDQLINTVNQSSTNSY